MQKQRGMQIGSVAEFTDVAAIRAALVEFVALLIFNFVGCGSVVVTGFHSNKSSDVDYNAKVLSISVAHGLGIAVLVSAAAPVSGGHLNPAVTFAMLLTGRITFVKSIMYWVAQIAGAILGTGLIAGISPDILEGGLGSHAVNKGIQGITSIRPGTGFLTEVVITFILIFVIWATAVDPRGHHVTAPLMIGLAVLMNHLAAIPITGASMNPARSFGAAVWSKQWDSHWIYWIGPLVGAALAALFYEFIILAPPPNEPTKGRSTEANFPETAI